MTRLTWRFLQLGPAKHEQQNHYDITYANIKLNGNSNHEIDIDINVA